MMVGTLTASSYGMIDFHDSARCRALYPGCSYPIRFIGHTSTIIASIGRVSAPSFLWYQFNKRRQNTLGGGPANIYHIFTVHLGSYLCG